MNELQARDKGYSFTGIYERNKDETNQKLDNIREMGYKAVLVTVPDSPLSRGTVGVGYSVYAERRYFIDKEIGSINTGLSGIEGRKKSALEKHKEELADIESDKTRLEQRLTELRKEDVNDV